jgi:hypothetical protein
VLGFDEVFGLSMTRTEDLFVMVCVGLGCIWRWLFCLCWCVDDSRFGVCCNVGMWGLSLCRVCLGSFASFCWLEFWLEVPVIDRLLILFSMDNAPFVLSVKKRGKRWGSPLGWSVVSVRRLGSVLG